MIKTAFRFSLLFIIGLLSAAGCGDDDDDDTEITNSQPVIDHVIVPDEVKAGEKVRLDVIAHDADGDALTYNWEVSEGTVDAAGVWTVPAEATSATVVVHVSDGVNTLVTSPKISVEIVPPPEPPEPIVPEGMVSIPAGEFQMGSVDPEAVNDEQPVHTVYIDAFFMDKYEVTNSEYQKFVLANPHWGKDGIDRAFHDSNYLESWNGNDYPSGKGNHPVSGVSWYAAMAYALWKGKRLPTEAEWEYAARGGLAGQKYPWEGEDIDPGKANYDEKVGDTTEVGKYPPNGYGLYDMAGNVWEWCLDAYDEDFYADSPRENPLSGVDSVDWVMNNFTSIQTERVVRGGSWFNDPFLLRVAYRDWCAPTCTVPTFGFRCVRAQ